MKKIKRIKYKKIYRVRWSGGSMAFLTAKDAQDYGIMLIDLGVDGIDIDDFKRPIMVEKTS